MPNPFVNTLMVWDGGINHEGLAEQFKTRVGPVDCNMTLGQFIYDAANKQNQLGSAASRSDQKRPVYARLAARGEMEPVGHELPAARPYAL